MDVSTASAMLFICVARTWTPNDGAKLGKTHFHPGFAAHPRGRVPSHDTSYLTVGEQPHPWDGSSRAAVPRLQDSQTSWTKWSSET
jgi:hypothetical protein